eukprot:2644693-Pyramimonas_sp.AAC.2
MVSGARATRSVVQHRSRMRRWYVPMKRMSTSESSVYGIYLCYSGVTHVSAVAGSEVDEICIAAAMMNESCVESASDTD